MLLNILTPRCTPQRLTQTVSRNLLRQHRAQWQRRHESTHAKPTPSPSPSQTPSSPLRSWTSPLLHPFRLYARAQRSRPYTTQIITTTIIYTLGDLSSQTISTSSFRDAPYEPVRALRAAIIGAIWAIPSYRFFMWLGQHFNYSSHLLSLTAKILFAQTFFTPCINTYFFGMQSLLSGGSLKETGERLVATVPVSWVNSWKVWPAVTAVNFTWVPPQHRNVFAGVVAVGWQTYLSWLNRMAEVKERSRLEGLSAAAVQAA